MRHSTAHLAVALCTTMAVSSAPLSPNPISPAIVSPMMISDTEPVDGRGSHEKSVPQKRSVGGFAYHSMDQNELEKRAAGDPLNRNGSVESFSPSDSDGEFMSGSESDHENDIGAASDSDIQRRSIPDIWTRSPPPFPIAAESNVPDFDDNASIASADENTPMMSDDESSSIASADSFSADDETSFASEFDEGDAQDPSNNQQAGAAEAVDGGNDNNKVEARSIDIGSQSERHGGRNYMSANSWNA